MRLPPTGSEAALRSAQRHSATRGRSVLPRHTGHLQQRVLINKSTCARTKRNIKDTFRGASAARFRAASRSTRSTSAFRH